MPAAAEPASMTISTADYTASELLAVMSARLLRDGQVVFAGVGIPLLAATLAQGLHAPGLTILFEGGVIGAFIAETTTPTSGPYPGLGREILTDVNFQTSRAYAGTLLLFLFAITCFYALSLAERKLAPWTIRPRGEAT